MSFNVKIKTSPALTPYYFRAWMKYALQVIVTSQERKEHKLNAESVLLSALLPLTSVSFHANLVKFCVVKFHQVYKLEPIQKHCF